MHYHIVVWPRRSSRLTFKELADSFVEYINQKYTVSQSEEFSTAPETTNIILGANDCIFAPREIPENSIIVNFEQLGDGQLWSDPKYIDILRKYPIWDYSDGNIEYLRQHGITTVTKIQLGYTASLETSKKFSVQTKDIDVLFFGALNQRRRKIGERLTNLGYQVHFAACLFGEERDKMIARSKIVLNIHYYESKILEIVRISHLLANKACVISEYGSEENVNKVWGLGARLCTYEEIVPTVLLYLFNEQLRIKQQDAGYNFIQGHTLELPI